MRGGFLPAALVILVTIADPPARLTHHMPVFSAFVYADTLRDSRFRGMRTGLVGLQFDGVGLMAGRYFINADSSDHVFVTIVDGDRVRLESPGEWDGVGILRDTTYWGVFVYRDTARDRRNRGARGTHLGTLESSGRLRIRGTFTNRAWPEFESSWTRLDPKVGTVTLETLRDLPVDRLGAETLRELPLPGQLEHPVWPPERGRAPVPTSSTPSGLPSGSRATSASCSRTGPTWTSCPRSFGAWSRTGRAVEGNRP